MIQGYAATASLIGSTLLALARQPSLRRQVEENRALLRDVIQEVLRCDPVTNSTIRFMARDGVIAGQTVRQGEMIIVLIAAANRDPALNSDPDRFDAERPDRKYLELGAGPHACPADKFAPLIAMIAVDHLLSARRSARAAGVRHCRMRLPGTSERRCSGADRQAADGARTPPGSRSRPPRTRSRTARRSGRRAGWSRSAAR